MAKIAARGSRVYIEIAGVPTLLPALKDWALNTTRGTIDVSSIESDWKEFLVGQAVADGSCNVFYDPDDPVAEVLEDGIWEGTPIKFYYYPQGVGSGKKVYSFTAMITGWNFSGATEDAVGSAVTFQGTGPVSRTVQGKFASLTTLLTGDNNDITLVAKAAGTAGNDIKIKLVDPASASASMSISVTNKVITVNLGTDATSDIVTTAAGLVIALNAHTDASALVTASLKAGETGDGIVTALTETALTGGE